VKKKLLRFGFGVFGGCRQKEGRFCFFGYSSMTSLPPQSHKMLAQSLVVF